MKSKDSQREHAAEFRRRAEETIRDMKAGADKELDALSPEAMLGLLHELRVHQVELEMQNEELRRAQVELDAARARYFDLYDLAPVGYVTVSGTGLILEANLTAATLLGADRYVLVKKPITRFILREDQDTYYLHRKQLFDSGKPQVCELRMVTMDGREFWSRLQATVVQGDDGAPGSRVVISDITERKQAEEALERAHAETENEKLQLEAVMEALPVGIAITDVKGGNVRSNREFERIWGGPRPLARSIEDYVAYKASWADTGDPVAPEEWASAQALLEGRVVIGQMLEIQRFDGSHAFILNSASPVRDAGGNIIGSAVAIQDITDLRKVQESLRESERLYRAIGETINYGVWVCDPDGRNIYASESFLNLVGMTQEQCSNFGWGDVLHPDDAERTISAWKECVRVGGAWDIEHRFRGVDGKWHDVLARGVPVRNERGEITCWAGINLDISRMKSAQEEVRCLNAELEAREERLRLALEAGKMGTWDWRILTGEVAWNDEQYHMLGYEVGAVKPSYEAWRCRVYADDLEATEAALRTAINEGPNYNYEFRAHWPDGTLRWLWALGRFDRDAAGQAVRSYGVLLDITQKKEAELEIKGLNEALKRHVAAVDETNKELESYSHSVSHDLRTPLRFVNRLAQQLLHDDQTVLSEEAVQQVTLILQATSEMQRLIEALLEFSQAVRQPMKRSSVDLRELFAEVWAEQEASRDPDSIEEGRRVEIVFDAVPHCVGDRTLLRQVASNLLSNAFKFSRHRDPVRITLGSVETGGEKVYFVQDNGVGFDMDKSSLLFRPFSRLHRSAGFEGTGIGLALVKRIIERHGGRVWAEGRIDNGATFYFTLGGEQG